MIDTVNSHAGLTIIDEKGNVAFVVTLLRRIVTATLLLLSKCGRVTKPTKGELAHSDWLVWSRATREYTRVHTVFNMSAAFGVHFGSTNACLAVCKVRVVSQSCQFLKSNTRFILFSNTHRVNIVFIVGR